METLKRNRADNPKENVLKQMWWEDGNFHTIDSEGTHMVYENAYLSNWNITESNDVEIKVDCEMTVVPPMKIVP